VKHAPVDATAIRRLAEVRSRGLAIHLRALGAVSKSGRLELFLRAADVLFTFGRGSARVDHPSSVVLNENRGGDIKMLCDVDRIARSAIDLLAEVGPDDSSARERPWH
jgi:hypothetical protein